MFIRNVEREAGKGDSDSPTNYCQDVDGHRPAEKVSPDLIANLECNALNIRYFTDFSNINM